MDKTLKTIEVSSSIEVTRQLSGAGEPYRGVKLRGFAGKSYDVTTTPEDDDSSVGNAINREMSQLFKVANHQVEKQIEKIQGG